MNWLSSWWLATSLLPKLLWPLLQQGQLRRRQQRPSAASLAALVLLANAVARHVGRSCSASGVPARRPPGEMPLLLQSSANSRNTLLA